jgi:uncharacterized membrane protein YdjX (TVP38/TMEM64 family)
MAVLALAMPPIFSIALFAAFPTIAPWLREHQGTGVAVYVAAFAILAGLAVLPTYAQAALGGFAFGFAVGLPAALGGFAGGALIGYLIARSASGDRAMTLINEHARWRAVRDALVGDRDPDGSGPRKPSFFRTVGMVALLRMPPNSPFALTNLVMAAVKVPVSAFILGTMVGMLPRTAAAVFIGASVKQLTKDDLAKAGPEWMWYVGIVLTVVVFLAVCAIAKKAVERVTGPHI